MNQNMVEIEFILKQYGVKFEKSKTRINADDFVMDNIVFVRERSNFDNARVFITTLDNPELQIDVVRGCIEECHDFIARNRYSDSAMPKQKKADQLSDKLVKDVVKPTLNRSLDMINKHFDRELKNDFTVCKSRLIQKLVDFGFENINECYSIEYLFVKGDFTVNIGIDGFNIRYKDKFIGGVLCDNMVDKAIDFINENLRKEDNSENNPLIKKEEIPDGYVFVGCEPEEIKDKMMQSYEDKKDQDIKDAIKQCDDVEYISYSEVVMIADCFSKYGAVNVMQQVYDYNKMRSETTKKMLDAISKE